MNFARCKCDQRCAQCHMHNPTFSLQVRNEWAMPAVSADGPQAKIRAGGAGGRGRRSLRLQVSPIGSPLPNQEASPAIPRAGNGGRSCGPMLVHPEADPWTLTERGGHRSIHTATHYKRMICYSVLILCMRITHTRSASGSVMGSGRRGSELRTEDLLGGLPLILNRPEPCL